MFEAPWLLPEPVENRPIRMQPNHPILHRHAMDEGLLVINEVGVRDPQLVGHPVVQGQVEGNPCVGQPLVPPGLLEVHGDGVVLRDAGREMLAHHQVIDPFMVCVSAGTHFSLSDTAEIHPVGYSLQITNNLRSKLIFLFVYFVQHEVTTNFT